MIGTQVGSFTIACELGEERPGSGVLAEHSVPVIVRVVVEVAASSRYLVGEQLGAGGMAEVYAGTMVGAFGFARPVAIKRVLPGLSQIPAFTRMFVAEAQIASRLAHPNIVSVIDFSRDPEDRLFLVMELVDGTDLASMLDAGPIAPSLAIFIAVEMLRGLGYAHALPDPASGTRGVVGVVHRDVSPQNLLLSYEGAVKVSDFGLAKVRAAGDGAQSEVIRGKPSYMSPEQCAGEPLDGRADLYAVGVMLWEMLAHRPLFVGTSKEILAQVMFKQVAPPRRSHGCVPADLAAIAMKLLARDRRDRYPTAAAAIADLLACGDAPRDGRGELASVLAERFPRAATAGSRPAFLAATPSQRRARVTVTSPSSEHAVASSTPAVPSAPRRRMFAATLSGAVLGCLAAAAAIGRDGAAQSGTTGTPAMLSSSRPAACFSVLAVVMLSSKDVEPVHRCDRPDDADCRIDVGFAMVTCMNVTRCANTKPVCDRVRSMCACTEAPCAHRRDPIIAAVDIVQEHDRSCAMADLRGGVPLLALGSDGYFVGSGRRGER